MTKKLKRKSSTTAKRRAGSSKKKTTVEPIKKRFYRSLAVGIAAGAIYALIVSYANAAEPTATNLVVTGEIEPTINLDKKPNEWGAVEIASCPDGFNMVMQSSVAHCVQVMADAGGQHVAQK